MQLNKKISWLLCVLLLAFVSSVESAQELSRPHLRVAGNELWSEQGNDHKFITSDPSGILHPRWSPRRDRIAYAHAFDFENVERSKVVILDSTNGSSRSLPIPEDSGVTGVLQLGWRDDDRVFIEGHVNPSTSKYMEWDVATGRLVDEKLGSWFVVSPDGRFVAQRSHVPHGAPPPYDSAMLSINGQVVYPPQGEETYHQFAGGLSWSTDNRLAFVDISGEATSLVILTPAEGERMSISLENLNSPSEVSWMAAADAVRVNTLDGDTWSVNVVTGKFKRTATGDPLGAKP